MTADIDMDFADFGQYRSVFQFEPVQLWRHDDKKKSPAWAGLGKLQVKSSQFAFFSTSVTMTEITRRFWARPASVLLSATGRDSP